METDDDRRAALRAVSRRLATGMAGSSSTSSRPAAEDIADTHGRWLEREPGIWERADWDEATRTLILRAPRRRAAESEMSLAWLVGSRVADAPAEEGFVVEALYGWFDRSPWRGGEDSVWVCRARSEPGSRRVRPVRLAARRS